MKLESLSLTLALAVLVAPAASAMHYTAPNTPILISVPSIPVNPLANNFSGCSSASNTVAVGYEIYAAGFRMLCADAGRIGFWTSTTPAALVGQQSQTVERFLCPSGTALGGLQFVEGLLYPFALCGELIPNFSTGQVQRTVLFTTTETAVEKESKSTPPPPGVVSCGVAGYVQSLQAARNAAGALNGFGAICNSIVTEPANLEDVNIDLAVKTAYQKTGLGRNATELFQVDLYNLGIASVPASNISLEFHFDGAAWQIQQFGNTVCTDIQAHKGVVDRIVVGKRCTIPGSALAGRGGVVSMSFQLAPLGSDVTRPATTTAQAIFSVKASILDERPLGADANAANNTAAFPVILQ